MHLQNIDEANRKALDTLAAGNDVAASAPPPAIKRPRPTSDEEESKIKRHARLESNRKAARESRCRKKVLVEDLQRSVVFYTRTNAQLRRDNEVLEGMLFTARVKIEDGSRSAVPAVTTPPTDRNPHVVTLPHMMTTAAMTAAAPTTTTTIATSPAPAIADPPPSASPDALPLPPPPAPSSLPSPADVLLRQQQQQQQQQQRQNTQNALMADWLAMARAARQVKAAANAAGMSGMVPNPMLAIPGLFGDGIGIVNPSVTTTGTGMGDNVLPVAAAGGGAAASANNFAGLAAAGNLYNAMGRQQLMKQQQQRQMMMMMGPGGHSAGAASGTTALT